MDSSRAHSRISKTLAHFQPHKNNGHDAVSSTSNLCAAGKRLTKLSRSCAGMVAIVTGAASGMGKATAELFADEGIFVACVDLHTDQIQKVVDGINEVHPNRAIAFTLDVRDKDGLKKLVEDVVSAWHRLDIIINNAGVGIPGGAQSAEDKFLHSWNTTMDVNLNAHIFLIRAALPHLLKSPSARVVNIASTEAFVGTGNLAAYTASKHGVVGLTKSLAAELGSKGNITFNAICPGPIHTGLTQFLETDEKERYARRRVPIGRFGHPEEVAHATLSLCLPAASYINGTTLVVDGGMIIRHAFDRQDR
ncbi:hypothetical protein SmJEL517_g04226 [Synchytrium microbalum]|uniref:3-oxoacyl-[acyl-carrier-protein] reductase n=1 Tax=Synchytrium microbalum TaxID=1806994 RepID=A0A507C3Z2_9FUNG|nr:uncharacterized protein SmJEL517_g04226 [Synchytrium microbalum]TPX32686.1 hypothetical protein SmJEL517_g04226 [Synchytrium microbalum]